LFYFIYLFIFLFFVLLFESAVLISSSTTDTTIPPFIPDMAVAAPPFSTLDSSCLPLPYHQLKSAPCPCSFLYHHHHGSTQSTKTQTGSTSANSNLHHSQFMSTVPSFTSTKTITISSQPVLHNYTPCHLQSPLPHPLPPQIHKPATTKLISPPSCNQTFPATTSPIPQSQQSIHYGNQFTN
jgi:hypothetical protein